MKDYTKYDFAAIVGAEVELQVKFFGCHKGKVLCRWEYQGKPYLTILVSEPDGNHLSDIPVDEIKSISAKIKVEDMSVNQMMEFCFIDGDCNYAVLYNDKTCVATCGKHAKNIELKDYIDCTDWGWKE